MASIKLKGDTSGEITISAPAVAGTTTLELPATSSTLATQNALGVRNLIINGDMRIAQRGTSVSGISTSANKYNTCDRWTIRGDVAGTWTQSQDTDVPTGQGFANSLKMQCTTAQASPAAGEETLLAQFIEGQMLQSLKKGTSNAESFTLSFWVKSNKTGTYIIEIEDADNGRSISQSYTISSADTWEKKTLTFAGDTTGTLDNDNAVSFKVWIYLQAGTDYTSGTLQTSWGSMVQANRAVGQVNLADSTSNYFNLTGVQLEVGDTATPFEAMPYDMQLARCQRYFQQVGESGSSGWCVSSTDIQLAMPTYVQTLRAAPSVSLTGNDIYIHAKSTLGNFTPTIVSHNMGKNGGKCRIGGATGLTIGEAFVSYGVDTPIINVNAEL